MTDKPIPALLIEALEFRCPRCCKTVDAMSGHSDVYNVNPDVMSINKDDILSAVCPVCDTKYVIKVEL